MQDIGITTEQQPTSRVEIANQKPLGVFVIFKPSESPNHINIFTTTLTEALRSRSVPVSLTVLHGYDEKTLKQLTSADLNACQTVFMDIDPTIVQPTKDKMIEFIQAAKAKQIATSALPFPLEVNYLSDHPSDAQSFLETLNGTELSRAYKNGNSVQPKNAALADNLVQRIQSLSVKIRQHKPQLFPGQK